MRLEELADTDEPWSHADLWSDLRRASDPCEGDGKGCGCEDDTAGDAGDKAPDRVKRRPARYHVSPTYGRPHVTDGGECWCAPTITEDGIAVHREDN